MGVAYFTQHGRAWHSQYTFVWHDLAVLYSEWVTGINEALKILISDQSRKLYAKSIKLESCTT